MSKHLKQPDYISNHVLGLCTSSQSVSSLLAEDPTMAPGDAWKELCGDRPSSNASSTTSVNSVDGVPSERKHPLERAAMCGKWGPTKPSELFLKVCIQMSSSVTQKLTMTPQIYHDALCTLDDDPSVAMVSPSLMGSCGVVPLTIISV